jgi:Ca2+-binding EF-hand superfamily protein
MSYSSEELRETFDHFDGDDNGRIDREEFGRLMDALRGDMSEDEIELGFSIIDSDGDGSIDYDEFEEWWNDR